MPVAQGYVDWCEQCGWNLSPPARPAATGRLDVLYERAGRELGVRLARRLIEGERLAPRLTATRAASYAIAAAIWLLGPVLAAAAVLLGVGAISHPIRFVGVVLLLVAFVIRPRLGNEPVEGVVLRAGAPTLHGLVDEIAAALGTPPPHAVIVDHTFNAAWGLHGIKRRRSLALGLPLLTVLPPQQRVALIGHELAHERNGDSSRGTFVGGAVGSLAELYFLVAPERHVTITFGLFEHLVNAFFWLVSRPVWWLLHLELHLLLLDRQRAEYFADVLAAETAGAQAVAALHERALLEPAFFGVVHHAARDGADALLERALRELDAVPERERERRRRVARLESARLDATHPPTAFRIELVEARGKQEPKVILDPGRSAAIDAELQPRRRAVEQTLVDEYRASLYY